MFFLIVQNLLGLGRLKEIFCNFAWIECAVSKIFIFKFFLVVNIFISFVIFAIWIISIHIDLFLDFRSCVAKVPFSITFVAVSARIEFFVMAEIFVVLLVWTFSYWFILIFVFMNVFIIVDFFGVVFAVDNIHIAPVGVRQVVDICLFRIGIFTLIIVFMLFVVLNLHGVGF